MVSPYLEQPLRTEAEVRAMTTIIIRVKTPRTPILLFLEDGGGKISISRLTEEELRRVGEEWTEKLIQRAAEIRARGPVS